MQRKYLTSLLKDIPGTYPDLTRYLPVMADKKGCIEELTRFVEIGDGVNDESVLQRYKELTSARPLRTAD